MTFNYARPFAAWVLTLGLIGLSSGCLDRSSAECETPSVDASADATGADGGAAEVVNACAQPACGCVADDGVCTLAVRRVVDGRRLDDMEVDCGPGRVTAVGAQTWFGEETLLFPGGSISAGCDPEPAPGSGEGSLFACCLLAP